MRTVVPPVCGRVPTYGKLGIYVVIEAGLRTGMAKGSVPVPWIISRHFQSRSILPTMSLTFSGYSHVT